MKTLMKLLLFLLVSKTAYCQNGYIDFKVQTAQTPVFSLPTTGGVSNVNTPVTQLDFKTYSNNYSQAVVTPTTELRVTAYYEDGYGANAVVKSVSLKVQVSTNRYGEDELKVTSYMTASSNYWSSISYCFPTKTYGNVSKEFRYQAFVNGNMVYFNL